jgi:deoxyribodipyrimidine photo-lyase
MVWLRRDLRLHDHPALNAALGQADRVIPVFCFDPGLLVGRHASGPRTQFLLECLDDLDRGLKQRGGRLFVRRGPPESELTALAQECGVESVHFSADVGAFARQREQRVTAALRDAGIGVTAHPGLFAVDDLNAIRTGSGGPYTVFTPFLAKWLQTERREVHGAPRAVPVPGTAVDAGSLPTLAELGLVQELADPIAGGERAARKAVGHWVSGAVKGYADDRDAVGADGVSRLSPYLHFGSISARELEARLPGGKGAEAYRRQLCWRDFYAHVLRHFPANTRSEHQERYRGKLRWSHSHKRFGAWCEGQTGFPLVDAGMRQLRREGWMHNRARLLVGSFLTKDLGIDWRWGERHFMRLLLDGDEASNNGNWQWIASVGVDPQPVFRRIFNPALQAARHDPDGAYIRRYVPELKDVPDPYLAQPSAMAPDVQESAGCVIGRDYPEPIVDHAQARRAALERYRLVH